MGAKKIKKRRFVPDTGRVNRALIAIGTNTVIYDLPINASVAPIPVWGFTDVPMPGPDNPDAPIPAIRPELVDPVVVLSDPHIVADFEKTGLRLARIADEDHEKVLLWLIDKSRALENRNMDSEFAIDMGPAIKNREMGETIAGLVRHGRARAIATGDDSKVILQLIFTPADYAPGREAIEATCKRLFPHLARPQ